MHNPPFLTSALLACDTVRHGFYGRRGGVSTAEFDSLNCNVFSDDSLDAIETNRQRVAASVGGQRIVSNKQVHGIQVRRIDANTDPDEIVEGDGLVTTEAGLCIGVLGADCAPLLFADPVARVIGAAHAGWRGALLGITDTLIDAMVEIGAEPNQIIGAIGPAIQGSSYQVGQELMEQFQAESPIPCESYFRPADADENKDLDASTSTSANDSDRYYFDLPGYLRMRIERMGVASIDVLPNDTFAEEQQFFSHRRNYLRGQDNSARQISAIVLT